MSEATVVAKRIPLLGSGSILASVGKTPSGNNYPGEAVTIRAAARTGRYTQMAAPGRPLMKNAS